MSIQPGDDVKRQLPAAFVERVNALRDGRLVPAEPRHAATVVLLRDGASGLEAYLLRRVTSMAFAAGMHVFPGGSVDPADAEAEIGWSGLPPRKWARPLDCEEPLARALVCAAVRETFEESGVLLAGPDADSVVDVGQDAPRWEAARQALLARETSLSRLLRESDLVLRADLLRAWAHWVTPEVEPKRFDTRFFVAALPAGQATRDVGGEADRTVWLSPREALDRHALGELAMLPPTSFTLAELAEYADVAAVLEAGARRDVKTTLPRVVVTGEQAQLVLPHESGYADAG